MQHNKSLESGPTLALPVERPHSQFKMEEIHEDIHDESQSASHDLTSMS